MARLWTRDELFAARRLRMMRTAPATSTDDTDIAVMYGAWSQSMTTASICVPVTLQWS
jgi:hypothetical protein